MEIIEDPLKFSLLAEIAIKKFGYAPEHNLEWFLVNVETAEKPVYVHWPDGTGLMTLKAEKEWYTFSEPLAPVSSSGAKILEFAEAALQDEMVEDVVVEVSEEITFQVANAHTNLTVLPVDTTLIWPVVNLKNIDEEFPGARFKGIRNIRNRFYRDHDVQIVDATTIGKDELYKIVHSWAEKRTGDDEVWPQTYLNLIDDNFKNTENQHIFIIDQKPVALTAGWPIPNSPNNTFYNGVAIHDYSVRDLGLFIYTENILMVKKSGYNFFDLGGVEEGGPLDFKKRFLPEYEYKTFIFSII